MNKTVFQIKKKLSSLILILLITLCSTIFTGIQAEDFTINQSNQNTNNNIIYLTGFPPFLNYTVNPSELVVNELNQTTIQNFTIYGRILPVDFTKAPPLIYTDIKNLEPSLIISLGLDAKADSITIELLSVNLQYDPAMNEPLKTLKRIDKEGPFFIPTTVDVGKMYLDLKEKNIPVSYSLSAGLYVCNAVFYETLNYLSKESLDIPMGFIHIPNLRNDNTNGMKIEEIVEGVVTVITSNLI